MSSFKDVVKYMIGCLFSICICIGIFILFAVVYENIHGKSSVEVEDVPHDYVEVDMSNSENVSIRSYNGYFARSEYTIDRWQTEDGVIAVTVYFEEVNKYK